MYDPLAMWQQLARIYNTTATAESRDAIVDQFNEARMGKQFACARDFIAHLRSFQHQLAASPDAISDARIIRKVLKHLPAQYDIVVRQLRRQQDTLTIDVLEQELQDDELLVQSRQDNLGSNPSTSATFARGGMALATTGSIHDASTHAGHGTGSSTAPPGSPLPVGRRDAVGTDAYTGRDYSRAQCFYCNQKGHLKRDCPVRVRTNEMNRRDDKPIGPLRATHRSRKWDQSNGNGRRHDGSRDQRAYDGNRHSGNGNGYRRGRYQRMQNRHTREEHQGYHGGHAAVAQVQDLGLLEEINNEDCFFRSATAYQATADQFLDSNETLPFDAYTSSSIPITRPPPQVPVSIRALSSTVSKWIVDSGASYHMTNVREYFTDLRPIKPFFIGIANGTHYPATGVGRVHIQLSNKSILTLYDVLYVPDFAVSLVSVQALNDAHYDVEFNARNSSCQVRQTGDISEADGQMAPWTFLGKGDGRSRTHYVYGKVERQEPIFASDPPAAFTANVATPVDITALSAKKRKRTRKPVASTPTNPLSPAGSASTTPGSGRRLPLTLWHQRFAHVNHADLKKSLSSLTYTNDVSPQHAKSCDICNLTKSRVKYQRTYPPGRASRPLEIIHSDLCGPIRPLSKGQFRYFVIFVDDYSRETEVVFLRSKVSEVVTKAFSDYKLRKEKEFEAQGFKIVKFRCDNGKGEYDNNLFRLLLANSGIQFDPAPPYTQHKNGVSERMIQTICRKARAMMIDSGLAAWLWAECVMTAVYLINRTPTSANEGRTPFEMLYHTPPRIIHFRRFGSIAFITIPKELQQGKFSARTKRCIFIGYVRDSVTIWRFYIPKDRLVVEASNVIFDESRVAKDLPDLQADDDVVHSAASEALLFGEESLEATNRVTEPQSTNLNDMERVQSRVVSDVSEVPLEQPRTHPGTGSGAPLFGSDQPQIQDRQLHDAAGIDARASEARYLLRPRAPKAYVTVAEASAFGEEGIQVSALQEADPKTFRAATNHPRLAAQWLDGIRDELYSLAANNTWEYLAADSVPAGANILSSKWVFKTKVAANSSIRYKARLVIRGFEQIGGVDYDETFAPVAKLVSLRMLLALSAQQDWNIEQLDVVTAFLNPAVDGDVYMEVPQGLEYMDADHKTQIPASTQVVKLRKALYGLKQAPRLWYQHIDHFLQSIGFRRCAFDPNVYVSTDQDINGSAPTERVIILLYVDDLLLFSASAQRIQYFKSLLKQQYRMTDLGEARQFLGLEIIRDRTARIIKIHQARRIDELLSKTKMTECYGQ